MAVMHIPLLWLVELGLGPEKLLSPGFKLLYVLYCLLQRLTFDRAIRELCLHLHAISHKPDRGVMFGAPGELFFLGHPCPP
jgi:hypothetical protein